MLETTLLLVLCLKHSKFQKVSAKGMESPEDKAKGSSWILHRRGLGVGMPECNEGNNPGKEFSSLGTRKHPKGTGVHSYM